MNVSPEKSEPTVQPIRPPQLIQSLVGGFNAVANNVSLIALPVALDLLLWFGPHLKLRDLFGPAVSSLLSWMRATGAAETRPAVDQLEKQLALFLERYNLFSAASTFPVGLPTRMASLAPVETPLGAAPAVEINSYAQFLLGWMALVGMGFLLGSLYFALIARSCAPREIIPGGPNAPADPCAEPLPFGRPAPRINPRSLFWQILQVFWMVALLLAALLAMMVPILVVTLLVALISPILAQFVLLVIAFTAVWFLTPLVFTPHGIFLCGMGIFRALLNSARVVRLSLPGTALFLLSMLVLQQGLGALWSSPPETSWLALVGILGHAFINTGLLAAMFIYYRGGLRYIQFMRNAASNASNPASGGSAR